MPVVDPTILKGGAKDNVLAPSSFIANAHNELYTEKGRFFEKKNYEPIGDGRPTTPPHLNPPLLYGLRRGSVVRTSVCSRWTFPDLRLIHG